MTHTLNVPIVSRSIMKGGAVALDGRIEPGDMILQVNDTNFENMSNDDAVRVLREVVQKPGPIKLVVAKCWDPSPTSGQGGGGGGGGRDSKGGYLTIPRAEPVRPIDPGAWVAHTAAVRGETLLQLSFGCSFFDITTFVADESTYLFFFVAQGGSFF